MKCFCKQRNCDLDLLRSVPTIKKLVVDPKVLFSEFHGGWDNLRYAPELEWFETPGRRDLGILVDAVAICRLGEMQDMRNMVIDLPVDFSAEDFAPLGNLKRLETLDPHCDPLALEHLAVLAQMSCASKDTTVWHPSGMQRGSCSAVRRSALRLTAG